MGEAMITAWAAVGAVGLAVSLVVTAHVAWRAGRIVGRADMLTATATCVYHVWPALPVDRWRTHPDILSLLDTKMDAAAADATQRQLGA